MTIPKGGAAVMAGRREPPKALDYFPTPPWATRALFAHVLPQLVPALPIASAWEPAAGEGHMAEVLLEFAAAVFASDVFDYGIGYAVSDFLNLLQPPASSADWIVTNPPFVMAEEFFARGHHLANIGFAFLLRTQWIEGVNRYRAIFRDHPPTIFAPFAERVPMVKGRWDPDADTMTAYAWFVWLKGAPPRAPFWIPPDCSRRLTLPSDRKRFAAWSLRPDNLDEIENVARELCALDDVPADSEISADAFETLTYRERSVGKVAARSIRVPQWVARRRYADDIIARSATREALATAA